MAISLTVNDLQQKNDDFTAVKTARIKYLQKQKEPILSEIQSREKEF
jgi:hypothetical protein